MFVDSIIYIRVRPSPASGPSVHSSLAMNLYRGVSKDQRESLRIEIDNTQWLFGYLDSLALIRFTRTFNHGSVRARSGRPDHQARIEAELGSHSLSGINPEHA
jgi:hypothetical protein